MYYLLSSLIIVFGVIIFYVWKGQYSGLFKMGIFLVSILILILFVPAVFDENDKNLSLLINDETLLIKIGMKKREIIGQMFFFYNTMLILFSLFEYFFLKNKKLFVLVILFICSFMDILYLFGKLITQAFTL